MPTGKIASPDSFSIFLCCLMLLMGNTVTWLPIPHNTQHDTQFFPSCLPRTMFPSAIHRVRSSWIEILSRQLHQPPSSSRRWFELLSSGHCVSCLKLRPFNLCWCTQSTPCSGPRINATITLFIASCYNPISGETWIAQYIANLELIPANFAAPTGLQSHLKLDELASFILCTQSNFRVAYYLKTQLT